MWISMSFYVEVTAASCSVSVTLADFVCNAGGSRDISGSLMFSNMISDITVWSLLHMV